MTELYDDLLSSLFHIFYFIFSAPISFSLWFPVSPSLFFVVLSEAFIKCSNSVFFSFLSYIIFHLYTFQNLINQISTHGYSN